MASSTWSRALLATLLLAGSARADSKRSNDARALLQSVLLAEGSIAFTATQTVIVSEGGASDATVTRERHEPGNRSRVEYVLPKSAAGRIIVEDGAHRWDYAPTERTVICSPNRWSKRTAADAQKILSLMLRSYRLQVEANTATIAGRPVTILRLAPLRPDRPTQTLYVDRATLLVLKREVFDSAGRLDTVSTFSDLRVGRAAGSAPITFKPPENVPVVSQREQRSAASLAAARKIAPSWARIPTTLGKGFDFEGAHLVVMSGKPAIHCQYTDGLAGVSLVEIQGAADLPADGQRTHSVRIGEAEGTITHQFRFDMVTWRSTGLTFSLVGSLPQELLLELAAAVR